MFRLLRRFQPFDRNDDAKRLERPRRPRRRASEGENDDSQGGKVEAAGHRKEPHHCASFDTLASLATQDEREFSCFFKRVKQIPLILSSAGAKRTRVSKDAQWNERKFLRSFESTKQASLMLSSEPRACAKGERIEALTTHGPHPCPSFGSTPPDM